MSELCDPRQRLARALDAQNLLRLRSETTGRLYRQALVELRHAQREVDRLERNRKKGGVQREGVRQ